MAGLEQVSPYLGVCEGFGMWRQHIPRVPSWLCWLGHLWQPPQVLNSPGGTPGPAGIHLYIEFLANL